MDNYKTILLIAILCLLVLAYCCWFGQSENTDHRNNKEQIKSLQQQNDSLINNNEQLDNQVVRLKFDTDSLMKLVSIDRQKISELKKNENEKIIAIDNFDNNELFDFFSGIKTDSTAN